MNFTTEQLDAMICDANQALRLQTNCEAYAVSGANARHVVELVEEVLRLQSINRRVVAACRACWQQAIDRGIEIVSVIPVFRSDRPNVETLETRP